MRKKCSNDLPTKITAEAWQAKGIPPPRNPNVTYYKDLSVEKLWSLINVSKNYNASLVTFKRPELNRGYFNDEVLITQEEQKNTLEEILKVPGVEIWKSERKIEIPSLANAKLYPSSVIRILNENALREIRTNQKIESIEPFFIPMGIGCSLPVYIPNPADTISSGKIIPWTFTHLKITEAWNLYRANPASGVRIGIIDTGVFQDEHLLTDFFANGTGRLQPHHSSVVSAMWDDCGHGTRLAGLATAPMFDGQNIFPKKIVGVAWGAELTTVKYNSEVIAGAGSRFDLVNAINAAVNDGAKIINLALGMLYWSTIVEDCIISHINNSEIIFVAAAGTSEPVIVFPAAMPQVLAVSIVKSKNEADQSAGYEKYALPLPEGAYGEEVDIVAINGDGDIPTTGGGSLLTSVGGSSSGTAHISGIIALMWGLRPGATRQQIISRLFASCSLRLITDEATFTNSNNVGHGIPDAYLATGGFRNASIIGPVSVLPGVQYTLKASTDGILLFNYQWGSGETTDSVTFTAPRSGNITHTVFISNPLDNTSKRVDHIVTIAPSHHRVLYSDTVIVRYPLYPFASGNDDIMVNENQSLPAGCAVLAVLAQEVEHIPNMGYRNIGPPLPFLSLAGYHGYEVERPGGLEPQALDVIARVWHGPFNAIRIKIHYFISEPDGVDASMPGVTVHGWYPLS